MTGLASAADQGAPSPIDLGTHDDTGLRAPIAFDPATAPLAPFNALPPLELVPALADWATIEGVPDNSTLRTFVKAIRPICVGALLAIPTVGPATVGAVAFFSERRAMAMVKASVAFLNGIPGEILVMIGALATGYGVARTIEKTLKRSDP